MKRFFLLAVIYTAFISAAYSGSAKRIYLWVNYPNTKAFARGVGISLNGKKIGYIREGIVAEIHIKGDKKYVVGVISEGTVMAETIADSLTEENTYIHGNIRSKGSTIDKSTSQEKHTFVETGAYTSTQDFDEEGLSDSPGYGISATAYGTGFLISVDGYIVTNYHVVENYGTIKLKGISGKFSMEYEAEVIAKDINNDLVLLKLKDTSVKFTTPPYKLRIQGINTGEDVSVLGYPLGPALGDEIKLTTGVVSAKSGVGGSMNSFQISAAAQPGNSGGPLFDGQGNVIGVVNAKIRNAENMTYAVKAAYIQTLVSMLPDEAHLPEANTMTGKNLPERVAASSKFVYIIKCQ